MRFRARTRGGVSWWAPCGRPTLKHRLKSYRPCVPWPPRTSRTIPSPLTRRPRLPSLKRCPMPRCHWHCPSSVHRCFWLHRCGRPVRLTPSVWWAGGRPCSPGLADDLRAGFRRCVAERPDGDDADLDEVVARAAANVANVADARGRRGRRGRGRGNRGGGQRGRGAAAREAQDEEDEERTGPPPMPSPAPSAVSLCGHLGVLTPVNLVGVLRQWLRTFQSPPRQLRGLLRNAFRVGLEAIRDAATPADASDG